MRLKANWHSETEVGLTPLSQIYWSVTAKGTLVEHKKDMKRMGLSYNAPELIGPERPS